MLQTLFSTWFIVVKSSTKHDQIDSERDFLKKSTKSVMATIVTVLHVNPEYMD